MRIKSKFKDYYDHVAHMYNGGDPNIVYDRSPIESVVLPRVDKRASWLYSGLSRVSALNGKVVVICGRRYLIARRSGSFNADKNYVAGPWMLYSRRNFPEYFYGEPEYHATRTRPMPTAKEKADFIARGDRDVHGHNWDMYVGEGEVPALVELSRDLGAPVFTTCDYSFEVKIAPEIPKLGDLGFATVIDPFQMYQDIAYFVGNTIKVSPDMMPRAEMTDKEKTLAHGFDDRISFRHRK